MHVALELLLVGAAIRAAEEHADREGVLVVREVMRLLRDLVPQRGAQACDLLAQDGVGPSLAAVRRARCARRPAPRRLYASPPSDYSLLLVLISDPSSHTPAPSSTTVAAHTPTRS